MEKTSRLFVSIIFILFLGYYVGLRYENLEIKYICMFLLVVLTVIYGINNYKKVSIRDLKLIIKIMMSLFFLQKYYLSFYLVIISKGVKRRKRLFYFLIISIFFYLVTLILYRFDLLANEFIFRIRNDGIIRRSSLGFGHPNLAMMSLLPIFFTMYYLWYEKNKLKIIMVILFISQLIYIMTNSRTGYFLIFIFIFSILIKDKYIYRLKYFIYSEIFFLLYFSMILSYKLKNTYLNRIVSSRFYLFNYYLTNKEITLLGDNKIIELYKILPLDNVYIRVLLEYGILGLIVLVFLILYIFKKLFKYQDYKAIRISMLILILGVFEGQALYYYLNIIYLIIYEYLVNKEENK